MTTVMKLAAAASLALIVVALVKINPVAFVCGMVSLVAAVRWMKI